MSNHVPSTANDTISIVHRRSCAICFGDDNSRGGAMVSERFRLVFHPDRIQQCTIWEGDSVVQFCADEAAAMAWMRQKRG